MVTPDLSEDLMSPTERVLLSRAVMKTKSYSCIKKKKMHVFTISRMLRTE